MKLLSSLRRIANEMAYSRASLCGGLTGHLFQVIGTGGTINKRSVPFPVRCARARILRCETIAINRDDSPSLG